MADVPGKFYRATKVRTGVSPSSAGSIEGEVLPPVNPPGSSLNSVGLTMPSAFTVSNSPLTANGTIGVAGAGTVGQYIRGDGSLADFPQTSGGGSSVSYYLNGSVDQGTIGGIAYKELSKVPILGAGTDFTINADGYIASFITDAGDPSLLEIPGGNWNFETYFSASSSGGTPTFYVELYKVSGTTATLIASSSSAPELIAFGTNLTPYFSTLAVPTTTLALTDRLAVRYYVTHSGRTITLHTENNHLCQIVTTFTTGITALNGLTAQVQNFAVGTTGTDFNIASATATHTFNLPTASATNRGALSSSDWSLFTQAYNDKINSAAVTGTTTKTLTLTQQDGGTITASWSDLNTDAVLSVFGRTGAVVAANGDYTTAQVTESGNLYYTDARSRAALSFAAGSGAYNTSTGVITIPTNNNQITNGAGYITSAALAGYVQGSASAGQVAYWSSGSAITGESALFWDSTNNRLGIDASSPSSALEVRTASSTLTNIIKFGDATVGYLTAGSSGVFLSSNDGNSRFMFTHTGDVGIGNNGTNGFKFDVTGTGRFTSNLTANSFIKSGGTSSQYLMADGSVSTLSNPVTGTGTTNYLPKFTGSTTIGNSALYDGGSFGGFNSTGLAARTFVINAASGRPLALELIENANVHAIYFRPNNSGYNLISSNYISGGVYLPLSLSARENNADLVLATSGNLLVGTTSDNGARLQVSGAGTFTGTGLLASVRINNTTASTGKDWHLYSLNNGNFGLYNNTDGSYAYQVTPSGNLGLGLTPSAWNSSVKVIEIANTGNFIGNSGNDNWLATNTIYDSGATFRYARTGSAVAFYSQSSGGHFWFNAPIGTAGNAISLNQAMTLTLNNNLLVGTPTDNGARLQVSGAGVAFNFTTSNGLIGNINSSAANGGYVTWQTSGTTIADLGTAQQVFGAGGNDTFGINARGARSLILGTNNTGRLTIDSTGAATFSSSVTAQGGKSQFVASGGASSGAGISLNTGLSGTDRRNWFIGTEETVAGDFTIKCSTAAGGNANAGDTRLAILNNGNVGIGTPSPNRKLEVITGSLTTNGIRLTYAGGVTSEGMDITYLNTGATTTSFDSIYNSDSAVMQFRMKTAGTPVTALSILGSGEAFFSKSVQAYSFVPVGTNPPSSGMYAIAPDAIAFSTNTTNRMTILGNGRVLIGTETDSGGRLQIRSSGSGADILRLDGTVNTKYAFKITGGANDLLTLRRNHPSGDLDIMHWGFNGNVLIGTATTIGPAAGRLDVQYDGLIQYGMNLRTTWSGGGLAISFNNSSGSQIGTINTTFSATSYNTSSDYRLKEDLKDFNGIDLINKIKTYDFKWKSENSRSYGVVAHELQEVINYAVHGKKDSLTMQGVDYSKLVPILIKAIQEQQVQIDKLKN